MHAHRYPSRSVFLLADPPPLEVQAELAAMANLKLILALGKGAHDQVLRALAQLPGITVPSPDGAFFAFPKFSHVTDSTAYTTELVNKTGVALAPGAAFGEAGEGFVRICFASSEDTVRQALARLQQFVATAGPRP